MVLYNTQDILGVCRRDFGRAVLVGGVAPRAAEPARFTRDARGPARLVMYL